MPELKILSGKKVISTLEKLGFVQVRQKGSHVILKKIIDNQDIGCVVPLHKEVAIGTLKSILKQANLTANEFIENI